MKNLNVSVFAVFSGIVVFSGIGIVNKWTGFYRDFRHDKVDSI